MTPLVRPMEQKDTAAVALLEAQVFSQPWSADGLEASRKRPEYLFLVACDEEQIIGYIGMYQVMEEGDITNVAVRPDCQGQGVGSLLVEALFHAAARRGIREITLEVRAGNVHAIRLYEKHGFCREGRRKNYYEKPREDALIMWNRNIQ